MPIFARRRLRSMLDELAPHFDAAKTRDLSTRLEHINTDTALAAEAELSMLWAISRVAHLTVEPELPNSPHRPEASSHNLFASANAVIEVKALSDDNFSGKAAMERTANIIAGYADQLRKKVGQTLHFEFLERSYWDKRFHRERCVDPQFRLTPSVQQILDEWITADDRPSPDRVRINEGKTDVVISRHAAPVQYFRVHCSMPPVAYDLEDNPIYKALKRKARQLKGSAPESLRCVFLVDADSYLLRQLRPFATVWEIGGEAIIRHALRKLSIDMVCVFSPNRQQQSVLGSESYIHWMVTCFDRRPSVPDDEYDHLQELVARLPDPRFESYRARDIHRQGGFNPGKLGWFLATTITTGQDERMTIKISSRLVHEYLAGRIDSEAFHRQAFGNERNFFDSELTLGHTIQAVRFEGGGLDEDDDYLIFDLDIDWSAIARLHPRDRVQGDENE